MNNKLKNILIVRTDRIGDVVLSLPLAGIIKKYYPESRITFLVRDYTKDIVSNHPFIDEVLIVSEKENKIDILDNIRNISNKKFDTCIVVNPTFTIALVLFFSGINNRIGTGYRWYSFLFNKRVFEHRKYAEKHELEFNLSMLKEIGINEEINKTNAKYDLVVDTSALAKVDEILFQENIDVNKKIIIVHPGSGGSSIDLPVSKFKQLVQKLNEDGYQIIITGNKREYEICNELAISNRIKNFAGKFNLKELIALISRATLFISNSTGPIHIAAALGKYTVGFYPKIVSCSKERWSPYTNKKIIYEPEINCNDCTREKCEKLNCMQSINVDIVYNDIKKILTEIKEMELK